MEASGTGVRFCVIADDLTGAMDTGVGLTKAGLDTTITFSSIADLKPEAVVATTDSRADSPTDAYRHVKAVGERFRDYYIYIYNSVTLFNLCNASTHKNSLDY